MTHPDKQKLPPLFLFWERRKEIFPGALLFVLVWLAFGPALKNDFVTFDDPDYVTANFRVQQGLTWSNVQWAFTSNVSANWHPLTLLSHMLTCQLFGVKPWGHHLVNVLLHTANTILLFGLFRKMTGAVWRSFFVAALFGVHPLHVESVAWISERKDVLSTFFGLLALLAYVGYAHRQSRVEGRESTAGRALDSRLSTLDYSLALVFFALGLMSKPMLVTLPFVLLLLDWWPLKRVQGSRFKVQGSAAVHHLLFEKWAFFLLSAIFSVVTYLAQKSGGSVVSADVMPLGGRAENALVCYCRYLGKIFRPENLSICYPPEQWSIAAVAAALLGLIAISIFVLAMRRYRYGLMGWLWFLGILVPAIGLVQSGWISMADRYSYVPAVGIFIMLTWGAWDLLRFKRGGPSALFVAGAVILVLCVLLTRRQVGYWADGETLFRHALAVTKDDYLNHFNLAIALNKKGRFDEGIEQLQTAIRLNPNDAPAYNNLGVALGKENRPDEAILAYQDALRINPKDADTHANLGIALGRKGEMAEAVRQLEWALDLDPGSVDAHYNLGNLFVRSGRLDDGIAQYQEAIKLNPNDADARNNLGVALSRADRLDEAVEQFHQAIRRQPDNAETHNNLGTVLFRKGLLDNAINEYQEALRLDPGDAETKKNLAMALKKKDNLLKKTPDSVPANGPR